MSAHMTVHIPMHMTMYTYADHVLDIAKRRVFGHVYRDARTYDCHNSLKLGQADLTEPWS